MLPQTPAGPGPAIVKPVISAATSAPATVTMAESALTAGGSVDGACTMLCPVPLPVTVTDFVIVTCST